MRIEVAGIPAPQGSKRHVGGGRMVESSRAVGPWREAVRAETQAGLERVLFAGRDYVMAGPKQVEITFYLRRPRSAPKRVKFPEKRPDVDKLARAVLDGLVDGGLMFDDGQVVMLTAVKLFANGRAPGCVIYVHDMEGEDDA